MEVGARRLEAGEAQGPASPWRLPLRSWPATLKRTVQQFLEDNLLQWAAALAFFGALSLFPAMLALVSVLGLIGAPAIQPLIDNVSELAPGTARDIALDALRNIRASERAGLAFLVGLGTALWTASGYVGAFIPAANVVWEVPEARPFLKQLGVRIALTLVLLLLLALTALSVLLTGPIARQVGDVVGLGQTAVDLWEVAKWPFLAGVGTLLLAILYWVSPNVRHPGISWVLPGTLLAVGLWIAASFGFTFYVASFSQLSATYGSIGGVLVFLIWLWLTNIAILLGAEFNAEIERARALEADRPPQGGTGFLPLRDAPEG